MDEVFAMTGMVIERIWGRFKREDYEQNIMKVAFQTGREKATREISTKISNSIGQNNEQ
jgi:hypothetical protein